MESNKDTIYELIENYLENRLPESEMQQVRQRIQQDAGFAREVEWMKTLLSLHSRKAEYAMLQNFRDFHRRQSNIRRLHSIRRWSVAAAVLVFLAAGWWRGQYWTLKSETETSQTTDASGTEPKQPQTDSAKQASGPVAMIPDQPKNQHSTISKTEPQKTLTPSDTPAENKSAPSAVWEQLIEQDAGLQTLGDEDHSNLNKALKLIDRGKKKEALPYLEAYLNDLPADEEDFEMRIEAGKIYLAAFKDFKKADFHLQKVLQSDALPLFKEEATYFSALNEYAAGNASEARKLLETLEKQGSTPWNTKAKAAISKLFR